MEISFENCDGCNACFYACPRGCIKVRDNKPEIDYSRCIYCYQCVEVCNDRHKSGYDRILPYLPAFDCEACGYEDCESFSETVEKEEDLERCPHLSSELKHALKLVISPEKYLSPYPISEQITSTKAGIFEVGEVSGSSLILATSDYLYTVTRITEALSFCSLSAYVAVVPSQGYCMRLASTLKTFNVGELNSMLEESKLKHKTVVLPKQARNLDLTPLKRRVIFGPATIEELPAYLIINRRMLEI